MNFIFTLKKKDLLQMGSPQKEAAPETPMPPLSIMIFI